MNRLLSLSRVTGFGVGQGLRSAVGTNPLGGAGVGRDLYFVTFGDFHGGNALTMTNLMLPLQLVKNP